MVKPGALRHRILDQRGAGGNARHPQPRLVELGLGNAFEKQRDGARIDVDGDAEGLGHRVRGDVVVGRADAAGSEDVGVAGAQRIQRRDDLRLDIGHDPDLAHVDADRVMYSAMYPMFLSLVRPDRISSPMTRIAAVTISPADASAMPVPFRRRSARLHRPPRPLKRAAAPSEPVPAIWNGFRQFALAQSAEPPGRVQSANATRPDCPLRRSAPAALYQLPDRAPFQPRRRRRKPMPDGWRKPRPARRPRSTSTSPIAGACAGIAAATPR